MASWNLTTTEDSIEHGDRYGVEDTSEEQRWCETCDRYEAESFTCEKRLDAEAALVEAELAAKRAREEKKARRTKLICSCGSFTCIAIVHFGLTVPTFQGAIEPIPSQFRRDVVARQLKEAGTL